MTRIETSAYARPKINFQGEFEHNQKVLDSLKFEFDEENNWYTYDNEEVSITITVE